MYVDGRERSPDQRVYMYVWRWVIDDLPPQLRRITTEKGKRKKRTKLTAFQKKFADQQAAKKSGKQTKFKEHEEIADVEYSPNGRYLAVGSRDNYIYIYNLPDYSLRGVLQGHSSYIRHVDWSACSRLLMVCVCVCVCRVVVCISDSNGVRE